MFDPQEVSDQAVLYVILLIHSEGKAGFKLDLSEPSGVCCNHRAVSCTSCD